MLNPSIRRAAHGGSAPGRPHRHAAGRYANLREIVASDEPEAQDLLMQAPARPSGAVEGMHIRLDLPSRADRGLKSCRQQLNTLEKGFAFDDRGWRRPSGVACWH